MSGLSKSLILMSALGYIFWARLNGTAVVQSDENLRFSTEDEGHFCPTWHQHHHWSRHLFELLYTHKDITLAVVQLWTADCVCWERREADWQVVGMDCVTEKVLMSSGAGDRAFDGLYGWIAGNVWNVLRCLNKNKSKQRNSMKNNTCYYMYISLLRIQLVCQL